MNEGVHSVNEGIHSVFFVFICVNAREGSSAPCVLSPLRGKHEGPFLSICIVAAVSENQHVTNSGKKNNVCRNSAQGEMLAKHSIQQESYLPW